MHVLEEVPEVTGITETIDADRAMELLRKVAEGKADFVYRPPLPESSRCVYHFDGKPSCMVGQALALAGATPEFLEALDGNGGAPARDLDKYAPPITSEAALIFDAAQSKQDARYPWGVAIEYAEECLRASV